MQAKGITWSRMLQILTAKFWFCVPYMWCGLGFKGEKKIKCHMSLCDWLGYWKVAKSNPNLW